MKIFNTRLALRQYLSQCRSAGKKTGLVPTMGALHKGHISLINTAKSYTDEVICSVFVNPTQFTDPKDLEKYPRPVAHDIQMLTDAGCDVLFMPTVSEMYAPGETWHIDIGPIENLLEGKYRPGHYQGVTQVVYKLFTIIEPDYAFFGQKDYQQVMVIRRMVELMQLPVKLIMCPIIREEGGLAMSSRNVHLKAKEHRDSLILSETLALVKGQFDKQNIAVLTQMAIDHFATNAAIQLDYFEIVDAATLLPADARTEKTIALVAAKIGNTRLIDNIILD